MDLAEELRETEWRHPSSIAELIKGDLRWDLVHPFATQDSEDKDPPAADVARREERMT